MLTEEDRHSLETVIRSRLDTKKFLERARAEEAMIRARKRKLVLRAAFLVSLALVIYTLIYVF